MLYTDYLDNFVQRNTLNPDQIHSGNIGDAIAPGTIRMSDTNFNFFQDYIGPDGLIGVDFITDKLDAEAGYIMGDFTFTDSGAISMVDPINPSNGLWISPNGIRGTKNGVDTFTITNEGEATFRGTLAAATGIIQNVVANNMTANNITITGGSISWADVTAPAYSQITGTKPPTDAEANPSYIKSTYIDSTSIQSPNISGGTITGSLIQTSPYSNTGVKISSDLYGIRVFGESLQFRDTNGNIIGWVDASGSLKIYSASDRDLAIIPGGGSGKTLFLGGASVSPLTNGSVSCGLSSNYWSNVYSNIYTFSGGLYLNTSSGRIQSNSNSRINGSLYVTGQLFMEGFSRINTTNWQGEEVDLYPYRIGTFNDLYSMYNVLRPLLSGKTIFVSF